MGKREYYRIQMLSINFAYSVVAIAALQQATSTAKRAVHIGRGADDAAPARPVDWASLSASAWKRHGALPAFQTMKGTGTVYFTAGRDVVREAVVDESRGTIKVTVVGDDAQCGDAAASAATADG
eukprot:1989658-Pleurochrysis_carterae.AAC.3